MLWGGAVAQSGESAAAPPPAADLLQAFLKAPPAAVAALERTLRARGPSIAPLLRAARKAASVGTQARIDRLYRRLELDFHRAHVPKGMVYVPAGVVELPRTREPWGPRGKRAHVHAFYLDRTEVTVAAWRRWLDHLQAAGGPETLRRLGLRRPAAGGAGDLPATRLRWKDAARYAKEARRGRLPEAVEFERALRGSSISTYPWGEAMRAGQANLRDYGPGRLVAVASYPKGAGPFGVLDLVGNAAEWSATAVRQGRQGRYPLVLGGSFRDPPGPGLTWRGKPRMRARMGPDEASGTVGFRVARDAPKLP